jgi:hypothetical protein
MNEYKITTTIGDLFVTSSSRKQAAIAAREDPRFDGVKIKKIGLHKRRDLEASDTINRTSGKFVKYNSDGRVFEA